MIKKVQLSRCFAKFSFVHKNLYNWLVQGGPYIRNQIFYEIGSELLAFPMQHVVLTIIANKQKIPFALCVKALQR